MKDNSIEAGLTGKFSGVGFLVSQQFRAHDDFVYIWISHESL